MRPIIASLQSEEVIKTIIFDLGNVIIPFEFMRGYQEMARLSGLPVEEVRARIAASNAVRPFESGHLEPDEFVRTLSKSLQWDFGYDEFARIWSLIFLPEPLFREEFIQKLKQNYRTVILSNTNAIHWKMIQATYPIVNLFDAHVLSYEVKAMKPSPVIYSAAVAKAECRPEECFFTDDIADYVAGAREHGIDAVQFQSSQQIEEELRARGVCW